MAEATARKVIYIGSLVHRTLAMGKPNRNRAVLVRFLKFQEKEFVYRETRKQELTHDGAKMTFAQDLSAETVCIRRGFHQVTKLFINIDSFRGFQHSPCRLMVLLGGRFISSQHQGKPRTFTKTFHMGGRVRDTFLIQQRHIKTLYRTALAQQTQQVISKI